MKSDQTTQFNIWTIWAIEEPQFNLRVNLTLLHCNSVKSHSPLYVSQDRSLNAIGQKKASSHSLVFSWDRWDNKRYGQNLRLTPGQADPIAQYFFKKYDHYFTVYSTVYYVNVAGNGMLQSWLAGTHKKFADLQNPLMSLSACRFVICMPTFYLFCLLLCLLALYNFYRFGFKRDAWSIFNKISEKL